MFEKPHDKGAVSELPRSGKGSSLNNDLDEAAMAEVGKIQQFKRTFGFWALIGITASMMCTWEGTPLTFPNLPFIASTT
jgi:hypothetical protein